LKFVKPTLTATSTFTEMEKFSLAAAIRMLDSDSLDPETFECDNLFDTNVNTDYLDDSSYAIRENHLSVETNDSEIGQLPLLDPINEDILNTSIESEELESETLSKDSADEHNDFTFIRKMKIWL
jgi:hypothetical protein